MGQFLLWIELVIASVFFIALGQAICARMGWRLLGWLCNGLWCLMLWVPWIAVVTLLGAMNHFYPQVCGQTFWSSLLAGIAMLLGSILTIRRAWRRPKDGFERQAIHWSPGKLALGWVVSVLVAGSTFWVMDQFVLQRMANIRLDAASMAMAATPPRAPDADNSALVIDQAVGMLKALRDSQGGDSNQSLLSKSGEWLKPSEGNYDPSNKQMLAFIQTAQPAIQLLHKAGDMSAYDPGTIYTPPSYKILLPNLSNLRNVAHVTLLSARVHADNGQMDLALADLDAAEALGRHVAATPVLISILVGADIESEAFETYQYLLDKGNLPANLANDDWEEKSFLLRNQIPRAMQMELAMGTDMFSHAEGIWFVGFFGGQERLPPVVKITIAMMPAYRCFFLENDQASYQDVMQGYQSHASLPHYEFRKKFPDLNANDPSGDLGPMGKMMTLAFLRGHASLSRSDALSGLMALSRGMIRYRQANGKYPDNFNDLTPKYLAVIPMDPFSGQSMKMIDKNGQRILYSIGQDMKDDMGVPPVTPNIREPGDIVLRLPK